MKIGAQLRRDSLLNMLHQEFYHRIILWQLLQWCSKGRSSGGTRPRAQALRGVSAYFCNHLNKSCF